MFKCVALVVLAVASSAPLPPGMKTAKPTAYPTGFPTMKPTGFPTAKPTGYPTSKPTAYPTSKTTDAPTPKPTKPPKPTDAPTKVIDAATTSPTAFPTAAPTKDHCTVKLYKNCFYSGYVGTFSHGHHYSDLSKIKVAGGEEEISSVEIFGNCAVMLFQGKDFKGSSKVLTQSNACLIARDGSQNWNDRATSFKVASLYLDNEDTPIGQGNKWVSQSEMDTKLVMVNYFNLVNYGGKTAVLKRQFNINGVALPYPTALRNNKQYTIEFATLNKDGSISKDGQTKRVAGKELKWLIAGQTGRLAKPTQKIDAKTSYKLTVQLADGSALTTKLSGKYLAMKRHNRAMKHLKITNDECRVTLFDKCDYQGKSHTFFPGHYPSVGAHAPLNNKVSSIKIEGNCKVRVFDMNHYHGTEKEYAVSQPCLKIRGSTEGERNNFNDRTTSLTVNSLDFEHFAYPTPYPTAFPTAHPTFHMDMPDCPLECTFHKHGNSKIQVTHNKSKMSKWRKFRTRYPGVYKSQHECWHEMPQGIDEIAASTSDRKGKRFLDVDRQGGCECRCS